jgi:putative phage-type endonuclease
MTELVQGSDEWFQARLGKVTASRVADVIARTKTGWGASRANYMAQLIAERLTGEVAPSYSNAAMQWGIDTEPKARAAYEFHTDAQVKEIGFKTHTRIKQSGASPDGLVGEHGLVEIKCPNTATHIDTLLGQAVPKKYLTQIQWQLACTGRQWCDFVSYDPRMPEGLALWIERVERDEQTIVHLEDTVFDFLKELDRKVADLQKLTTKETA